MHSFVVMALVLHMQTCTELNNQATSQSGYNTMMGPQVTHHTGGLGSVAPLPYHTRTDPLLPQGYTHPHYRMGMQIPPITTLSLSSPLPCLYRSIYNEPCWCYILAAGDADRNTQTCQQPLNGSKGSDSLSSTIQL